MYTSSTVNLIEQVLLWAAESCSTKKPSKWSPV